MGNPVQTIPNLPPTIGLTGLEEVWVNQAGRDVRTTTGAIATMLLVPGAFVPALITSTGALLFANGAFSVKTGLGAFSGTLPQVSTVRPGSGLSISDIDNNAGMNPYTINAFPGDLIADHGALSAFTMLSISNTRCILTANATVAPYTLSSQWTVIFYGQ